MGTQHLGLTTAKDEDFPKWYEEVVEKAGLAEHAPVGGCMVIRPWGMKIWERIQDIFDAMIEDEVDNCYFPLFIPESYLEKEKHIVEGFDPEVAWVSEGGDKELEERVAIRPTSESIISPFMAKWIRSYRDLPLRLNQWCNVVRWEATDTRYFLRTREFLWQEGHTAHATNEKADEEMLKRLLQYKNLYEDFLAIPALIGRKPEHDKFPGAEITTTIEALMPSGRSVQGGTSHNLGQKFAKAYDIMFEDSNGEKRYCWTASWGLSTRAIGTLIMVHGDDNGLILPPRIAPIEVVIVPIYRDDTQDDVLSYAEELRKELDDRFRVKLDDRDYRSPGFKFNEWELKGVPLRIEIGPREAKERTATLVHRHSSEKVTVDADDIRVDVLGALKSIQQGMYETAEAFLQEHTHETHEYDELLHLLEKQDGYVKVPWCGSEECENDVQERVHAHIVMLPLDREKTGRNCVVCGGESKEIAWFAKKY